jgi:glycosyltransferase involved in cell wall biosynthesis
MNIIIDFRKYDGVVGGVEQGAIQVTRYLCSREHEVTLVCKLNRLREVQDIFDGSDDLTIVPVDVPTHEMSIRNARLDSGFIQNLAREQNADLIHFFYNWSFPFQSEVPCILTLHDVIPFTFREAMPFFTYWMYYRPGVKLACRLNDVVTTVSDFSRRDISDKVGISEDKIRVVPNGLREPAPSDEERRRRLTEEYGLQNGYVLNVGGIHERKNIPRLVRAFARLVQEQDYPGKLVITGKISGAPYQDKMREACQSTVSEVGMEDRVVFTGFVSEDDLDQLLRDAAVLVYPSLYEGFGIPVLEAMKVDTPVITSADSAMAEVSDDAAVLVDPTDVGDMKDGMGRVLNDPQLREDLVEQGREAVRPYTWEACAQRYLEVYREVAGKEEAD